jgi:hypothetical protein
MIILVIVRRAQCEICSAVWDIEGLEPPPERCPHCQSLIWEFGPEPKDRKYIRQGLAKNPKTLNPGAKSKKRQDHGRKQWRQFKPKPVDENPEPQ